ncbi:hypothetical protein HANVADRAFT_52713 [Hanseniaspora valbyensis NRRL Y-1626]|uniref:Uncharacterized protein n=1 Tax=Hanseniaspora valbyensis NRRL Y-1626 TaxID=766949 RepID=A0A1B7TDZ1_9ASCO|nr:hypothetical protein HANVADRAFT_52713 [Hanseniaspora valbyensis NRRL Y-1626]
MAESDISDTEYIPPSNIPLFDFVEVDNTSNIQDEQNEINEEDNMEFAFPLFSTNPTTTSTENGISNEDNKTDLRQELIVSLRDATEDADTLISEHNKTQSDNKFGRIIYKSFDIEHFNQVAIDYDSIFSSNIKYNDKKSNSIIEIVPVNGKITIERKKTRKLGQRQRQARKIGLQREEERKAKDLEMKKLIKKKFHKRGGKRNANKSKQVNKVVKFRTE